MGHAVSQSPQWAGDEAVTTHAPAQLLIPLTHVSEQAPPEHTLPAGQTLSHAPQRAGSLERSTHAPSHSFSGAAQVTPQTPATQVAVALA